MKEEKQRNIAFDILRILSAVSIIIMHITDGNIYSSPVKGSVFWQSALLNSISHFGVPVFVMISGALFLAPGYKLNLKRLWLHNILRLCIVYIVWSFAYGIYDYSSYGGGFKQLIWCAVIGRPHLWFLPMIIGIYIILPFIVTWVRNASVKEIRLFILLFFIFNIVCETIKAFKAAEIITFILDLRNIQLVCSYVGYFIIGYYVVHIGLEKKVRKLLYCAGMISGILSAISVILLSNIAGTPNMYIVDSYSIFTFFWSAAIFTFVFEKAGNKTYGKHMELFWGNIGKDTLGLYLCHLGIIEIIYPIRDFCASLPVIPGFLLYTLIIAIIGLGLGAGLRRIPFIGRYIC